jgi:hypothetical protein
MMFFNTKEREVQQQKTDAQAKMIAETLDRVTRLETRLVQLMHFLGADINTRYDSKFSNRKDKR